MPEKTPELVSGLVLTAQKQWYAWDEHLSPRLRIIRKYEDMYAMRIPKRLKGRFNIPLPIVSGFVDTFKSKIDEAPSVDYIPNGEADIKVAKKVTAVWEQEKGDSRGELNDVDDSVKHLAILSGRGVYKTFNESKPEFKTVFDFVDYYDHIFEPQGGSNLDNHIFKGQQNIFKLKSDLEKGAEEGLYDPSAVRKMIAGTGTKEFKQNIEELEKKNNRMTALGLAPTTNEFVGVDLFNLTEMVMNHMGGLWYLFYDRKSGIALRAEPLKDVFKSELCPWVSFATHKDPVNYMSKAPLDDIFPVAEGMIELFNEGMDNMQKRNWGMRGVDTDVVKNPSQLKWRPGGIVEFNGSKGNIRNALVDLETPDNTVQITNLVSYLDNFLGTKTAITQGIQGQSEKDKKVGVFFGELEQAADRINAVSKQYRRAHAKIALRFVHGLNEHLTEDYAIKVIGDKGVEWSSLKRKEMTIFDVSTSGGSQEAQANEVKRQKRGEALSSISQNPDLTTLLNKEWLLEQILSAGDFEDEDIRMALDTKNDGNQEIMGEAAKAIEDIMLGKKVELNKGATTGFVRKIIDFSYDKDIKQDKFNTLLAYAEAHIPIARENMERKAKELVQEKLVNEFQQTPLLGEEGAIPRQQEIQGQTSPQTTIGAEKPLSTGGVGSISAQRTASVA